MLNLELLTEIQIDSPFFEQDNIQEFLGNPIPQPETVLVPGEMLYKFIKIAEKIILNNLIQNNLDGVYRLKGLKLQLERKVLLESKSGKYRVESQFVTDDDWRSKYDELILVIDEIDFLVDPVSESLKGEDQDLEGEEIDEENDEEKDASVAEIDNNLSKKITDRIREELTRLYPRLEKSEELHIHLFSSFETSFLGMTKSLIYGSTSCTCKDSQGTHANRKKSWWGGRCVRICP